MQLLLMLLVVVFLGYLLGCVHGSQIVGKYKNINIKKSGMKNSGATNATLLLGWKFGLIVALVDIGKAVLSLSITAYLLSFVVSLSEWEIIFLLLNGLSVVIGHNFPITMNFDGGKGTASFFGFLLFMNWKFALICLFLALIISFLTNYFVIGTFSGYIMFNMYMAYWYQLLPIFLGLLFTILFLIKHAENFKRIINNEEIKLRTFFRNETS